MCVAFPNLDLTAHHWYCPGLVIWQLRRDGLPSSCDGKEVICLGLDSAELIFQQHNFMPAFWCNEAGYSLDLSFINSMTSKSLSLHEKHVYENSRLHRKSKHSCHHHSGCLYCVKKEGAELANDFLFLFFLFLLLYSLN